MNKNNKDIDMDELNIKLNRLEDIDIKSVYRECFNCFNHLENIKQEQIIVNNIGLTLNKLNRRLGENRNGMFSEMKKTINNMCKNRASEKKSESSLADAFDSQVEKDRHVEINNNLDINFLIKNGCLDIIDKSGGLAGMNISCINDWKYVKSLQKINRKYITTINSDISVVDKKRGHDKTIVKIKQVFSNMERELSIYGDVIKDNEEKLLNGFDKVNKNNLVTYKKATVILGMIKKL